MTSPNGITRGGGPDDDTLIGGVLVDTLRGSGGDDLVVGGNDNDTLTGSSGNDVIWGERIIVLNVRGEIVERWLGLLGQPRGRR
jgi:Ca2+-binding RTX toxin-like protein